MLSGYRPIALPNWVAIPACTTLQPCRTAYRQKFGTLSIIKRTQHIVISIHRLLRISNNKRLNKIMKVGEAKI